MIRGSLCHLKKLQVAKNVIKKLGLFSHSTEKEEIMGTGNTYKIFVHKATFNSEMKPCPR